MNQPQPHSIWDCNRASAFVDAAQLAAGTSQQNQRCRTPVKPHKERRLNTLSWGVGLIAGLGIVSMISAIV